MTVLYLDDVKDHLNITSDANDDELAAIIAAAEAAVVKKVGPLEPTEVTSIVDSGGSTLTLPCVPVISVTTIASTWTAPGALPPWLPGPGQLQVNGTTGVVSAWPFGVLPGRYTVTYIAGRLPGDVPDDLVYAVMEQVRHMWETQRGPNAAANRGAAQPQPPSYMMPYRVMELLAPYKIHGFGML